MTDKNSTHIPHDGWHAGPPPHIGWWNASVAGLGYVWRWWNGGWWSDPVHFTDSCHNAELHAAQRAVGGNIQNCIKWSHYYPANARVPRVKP